MSDVKGPIRNIRLQEQKSDSASGCTACGGNRLTAQIACMNSEGFDIFHAITSLRMHVCVMYVDTYAIPVGARCNNN
jgi:hypothetical protein